MLDTARFSHFVADRLGVPVSSVRTLTLGSHGDTMVPVPSACSVGGKPLVDLGDESPVYQAVAKMMSSILE
jgi:malate dehydrogenase